MFSSKISLKSMSPFCRELATAHSAGLPILRSLEVIGGSAKSLQLRRLTERMADSIRQGQTLRQAAEAEERYLPRLFIEMVSAGEMGGRLEEAFRDLADYYERKTSFVRAFISQLIYPMLVLMFAGFVVALLMAILRMQARTGGAFNVTVLFEEYTKLLIVGFLCLGIVIVAMGILARLGLFKYPWGFVAAYVWPVRPLTVRLSMSRFARSFGLLLASGVNVIEALRKSASTADNVFIEQDLLRAVPSLQSGETLVSSLARSKFITPKVREILLVGEESGRLPEQLQRLANQLDEEATFALKNTAVILGVVLFVVVAAIVGFIVISFWTNYYGRMLNDLGV